MLWQAELQAMNGLLSGASPRRQGPMRMDPRPEPNTQTRPEHNTLTRPVARQPVVKPSSPPPHKGPYNWQMEQALHAGPTQSHLQVAFSPGASQGVECPVGWSLGQERS